MPSFGFEVCGSAVRLEGSTRIVHHARTLFRRMETDTASRRCHFIVAGPSRVVWTRPDGASCSYDLSGGHLVEVALAALVATIVAFDRPGVVLLHGNALFDAERQRCLLIVGDSGAGKTTLTRELIAGGIWRPVAEDMVAAAEDDRRVQPFPRAMSRRIDGAGAKVLDEFPPGDVRPASLAGCTVVLLGREEEDQPAEGERWALWMTSISDTLAVAAAEAGGDCDSIGGFSRILLPETVGADRRGELLSKCAEEGSLVVHCGPEEYAENAFAVRPAVPRVWALEASAALPMLARSAIRPWTGDAGHEPPGLYFMRLARVFRDAAFVRMVPGGTPGETVAQLLKTIDG